jgi:hypothetical protein
MIGSSISTEEMIVAKVLMSSSPPTCGRLGWLGRLADLDNRPMNLSP